MKIIIVDGNKNEMEELKYYIGKHLEMKDEAGNEIEIEIDSNKYIHDE